MSSEGFPTTRYSLLTSQKGVKTKTKGVRVKIINENLLTRIRSEENVVRRVFETADTRVGDQDGVCTYTSKILARRLRLLTQVLHLVTRKRQFPKLTR